jgi:hypothetical protein
MDMFTNPNYRKSTRTQYQLVQAAQAVRDGLIALGVQSPSDITVAKLLSQARLETGTFRYCWNHNWGNVKRAPNQGPYHMIRCNENIKGVLQWFDPPHIQCCFAAYDTQAAGASAWMGLILKGKRYAPSRVKMLDDSVSAHDFVWQLGVDGYYTANKTTYSNSVQDLFASSLVAAQGAHVDQVPVIARPGDLDGVFIGRRTLKLLEPRLVGPDVLEVQVKLVRLGFYKGLLDSEYGPKTFQAVKDFQKVQGIKQDGECGTNTFNCLDKI